ncbi:hypothetical protein M0D48_20720 [Xanthomonas prunicola]|uniref:tetratricopeptide repeat protein n=1 Tax=Xanthomonas prunicola TaxID=2053930 RepID=UPI0021B28090|nr:hypothetical protein [Xanthomonas prunicola]UXA61293.1 hypothetical protein M0D48_20720 [Xanthomonas prunicola]
MFNFLTSFSAIWLGGRVKRNYLFAAALIAAVLVSSLYISQFQKKAASAVSAVPVVSSATLVKADNKARGANLRETANTVQVPTGSYGQVVKRLERSAQLGDAEAALGLYLKSNACVQALSTQLTDDEIKAYAAAGIKPEQLENSISGAMADCKDATPDMLAKRGQWLRRAAEEGNVDAQLLFATDSEAVIGDARDMLRDPSRVAQYKKDAVAFLARSASKGNVDAMSRLGDIYRDGILAPKDLAASYSYYRAAEDREPGLYGSILTRMRSQMTAAEVSASERRAASISGECCS